MSENIKTTQTKRVLDYIKKHGSITSKEAMNKLGVWRLASRISELKSAGEQIQSYFVEVQNRWGEICKIKKYFLRGNEKYWDVKWSKGVVIYGDQEMPINMYDFNKSPKENFVDFISIDDDIGYDIFTD